MSSLPCHHFLIWCNFCMWKYNKRIFAIFLRLIGWTFSTSSRFCCRRRKDKKRKGKGKYTVTRRYISAICGADTPWLIPIKFGMRVAPQRNQYVQFCNKISRGFRFTGGHNPRFPIDFAGHRYNSAQPVTITHIYSIFMFAVC